MDASLLDSFIEIPPEPKEITKRESYSHKPPPDIYSLPDSILKDRAITLSKKTTPLDLNQADSLCQAVLRRAGLHTWNITLKSCTWLTEYKARSILFAIIYEMIDTLPTDKIFETCINTGIQITQTDALIDQVIDEKIPKIASQAVHQGAELGLPALFQLFSYLFGKTECMAPLFDHLHLTRLRPSGKICLYYGKSRRSLL